VAPSDSRDVVSVERMIPAPAEAIFALLTDPNRHRDIDGSGSVRAPKASSPDRLELGSQFHMNMRIGLPYSMISTVIEFEPDRRIAWQTRGPTPIGKHVAGRIWRYELEPVEGGTVVRETWDITHESAMSKPFARMGADATAKNMAATLERIEQLLKSDGSSDTR
jgi:uncharacterized protein YndB with AHSA1/START domain